MTTSTAVTAVPVMDGSDAIFTYMTAWEYIRLPKPTRIELLRQYIEWPRVPADIQAHAIYWFKQAIALNREMLDKDPSHAHITANVIRSLETLLQLHRDRSSLATSIADLHNEYETQRLELPAEDEVMPDSWPETLVL